ncbi:hypothetical protein [Celeribacter sp.]|uniref:hypothetical protein n=1 Tax=Celeribacter sp. TaxID=1890673 RepID=UPI003A8FB6CF
MNDYIAKARANRIIALSLHSNGATMFFPEAEIEPSNTLSELETRRAMMQVSKPMFVRSQSLAHSAIIATPDRASVANASNEPFILTQEYAVTNAA